MSPLDALVVSPPAGVPVRGRLLLVPGNDLPPEFYRPLAGLLAAAGVRAAVLRVPAFLGEPGPAPPTWDGLVDAVLAAVDVHLEGAAGGGSAAAGHRQDLAQRGPERARRATEGGVLAGHSLGGLLALLAAARRPAGVARLALLEPAVVTWRALAVRAARTYARDVVLRDRERFVNWTGAIRRVHDVAAFPRAALELYLAARRAGDPARVAALLAALPALYPLPLPAVRVPVLLLRGTRSGWRAALAARVLASRLRRARVQPIPAAAHWLANEADAALARALLAFASVRAGPPARP